MEVVKLTVTLMRSTQGVLSLLIDGDGLPSEEIEVLDSGGNVGSSADKIGKKLLDRMLVGKWGE